MLYQRLMKLTSFFPEINTDELPEIPDLLHILSTEKAPLHIWVTLALEYFRQNMEKEFVSILEKSRYVYAFEIENRLLNWHFYF